MDEVGAAEFSFWEQLILKCWFLSLLNLLDIISKFHITATFASADLKNSITYSLCSYIYDLSPYQSSYDWVVAANIGKSYWVKGWAKMLLVEGKASPILTKIYFVLT